MKKLIIILILLLPAVAGAGGFPNAEGWGSDTRHAWADTDPSICIVDDLTDNNGTLGNDTRNGTSVKVGSFEECFNWAIDDKIILFEVSGIIRSTVPVKLTHLNDNLWIAGQSAPDPGILLRGYKLAFGHEDDPGVEDILVQHIRVAIGDDAGGLNFNYRDNVNVLGSDSTNIVIDHVSMRWSSDENAGVGGKTVSTPNDHITYSNCILAEPLRYSGHTEEPHDYNMLVQWIDYFSLIKNLFIGGRQRNPQVDSNSSGEFINNLIINAQSETAFLFIFLDTDTNIIDLINNRSVSGPNSGGHAATEIPECFWEVPAVGTKLYWINNIMDDEKNAGAGDCTPSVDDHTDWQCVYENPPGDYEQYQVATPQRSSGISIWTPANLKTNITSNVGAWPNARDSRDTFYIGLISDTSNTIRPDSVADAGGWPTIAENSHTLNIPSNPFDVLNTTFTGSTRIEEWIAEGDGATWGTEYAENIEISTYLDFSPAGVGGGTSFK